MNVNETIPKITRYCGRSSVGLSLRANPRIHLTNDRRSLCLINRRTGIGEIFSEYHISVVMQKMPKVQQTTISAGSIIATRSTFNLSNYCRNRTTLRRIEGASRNRLT